MQHENLYFIYWAILIYIIMVSETKERLLFLKKIEGWRKSREYYLLNREEILRKAKLEKDKLVSWKNYSNIL